MRCVYGGMGEEWGVCGNGVCGIGEVCVCGGIGEELGVHGNGVYGIREVCVWWDA